MKKISIIIFLMISLVSLLLSGCDGVGIIPEVNSGNSEYQEDTSDTGTIDTGGTVATEGVGTISDINNDKTPPEATITLPGTGEYVLNQLVVVIWSATDDLSGVVSPISGTISINTSSVGTKTFTLPVGTAKDKAGNSSLEITISYSVIADAEDPETGNPQKWSGLGMVLLSSQESYVDTLLDNGFEELRIDIPDYQSINWLSGSKDMVIRTIAKGAKVIWGVTSYENTITAANWPNFRQAILDNAQWAQDNGVYEFQIGNEEENHIDETTMPWYQIIANLKSVATEVQEIFTNGKVSYSCDSFAIDEWVTAGRGDIDIIASNIYKGVDTTWQTNITALVNGFGIEHTYITEFNFLSTDEAVQAEGTTEMIDYINASGIKRALFYCWHDNIAGPFGVIKNDGTYRLLWNQALLNTGPVKFATVPTKTNTISLPDTIALIHK